MLRLNHKFDCSFSVEMADSKDISSISDTGKKEFFIVDRRSEVIAGAIYWWALMLFTTGNEKH